MELSDAWQGSVVLSSMASSAGAAGCSSKGSAAGLVPAGWRDFTASLIVPSQLILLQCEQAAGCSQGALTPVERAVPARSCGGTQMASEAFFSVLGISCH